MKRLIGNLFFRLTEFFGATRFEALQKGLRRVHDQEVLIDYLKRRVQELQMPPRLAVSAPDWTHELSVALRGFLATPAGGAFLDRLRAVRIAAAIAGAKNTDTTVHAAGMSAGWDEAVRYIETLSRVSGDQDTKPTDERPRGETDLLEQLSP